MAPSEGAVPWIPNTSQAYHIILQNESPHTAEICMKEIMAFQNMDKLSQWVSVL